MLEELLRSLVSDGGRFAVWVAQYPLLAERVTASIDVLQRVRGSREYHDLVAGRDVTHSLYMIALEGSLVDAAHVFYTGYVSYCHALLPWAYGREVG